MAFTRKFLAALGIEADKVDEIISAHAEVVDALKADRDQYKSDAEKLTAVQSELDLLKSKGGGDEWKAKYDAVKKDFDQYKADVAEKEITAKKRLAYRDVLKEIGISDKAIESVVKATDFSGMKLKDDGTLDNVDELKKAAKTDWAGFVVTDAKQGASVPNPPSNTGGKMSKDQIMAIRDTAERQKAIAENHELFGF